MKIALIGYGKMGKEVEAAAGERSIGVGRVFTEAENPAGGALTSDALRGIDVCIDFSSPAAAVDNIRALASAGCSVVVGTTGWYDRLGEVRTMVHAGGIGLLYSPNFSLGVAVFLRLVEQAGRLLAARPEYDVAVMEQHHRGKADSPSGTAGAIAEVLLKTLPRKTEILAGSPNAPLQPHQLHVSSARIGHTTGTHTVLFDSAVDMIELTHTARSRRGFALGALIAAEWLRGRKGVYTLQDVIRTEEP